MYVLVRSDGAFVNQPGSDSSYTRDLQRARVFSTKEQAEKDRCVENESVRSVHDFMPRPR